MAYACVERVLVLHPTTMRVNSVRPMLLGACVIASKTSRDGDLGLRQVAHLSRSLRPPTCAPPDHPPAAPPQLCAAPELRHTLRRATLPPAVPKRTKRNSRHRHGLARPHRAPDARGAALELLTQPDPTPTPQPQPINLHHAVVGLELAHGEHLPELRRRHLRVGEPPIGQAGRRAASAARLRRRARVRARRLLAAAPRRVRRRGCQQKQQPALDDFMLN